MREEIVTCDACLKKLHKFDQTVNATLTGSKGGVWRFELCIPCWEAGRSSIRTLWQRLTEKKHRPDETHPTEEK